MGVREESHKTGAHRRRRMGESIERHTSATCEFRGGSEVVHFVYEHKSSLGSRITTSNHKIKPDGLDMFIDMNGETIWASFIPEHMAQRKMVPYRQYVRVKAPNPGKPKTDEEVTELFQLQWAIIGRFLHTDDLEPFEWQAVKMRWFFEAGKGECPYGGWFPTGENGRPSTVRLNLATPGVTEHIYTIVVPHPRIIPIIEPGNLQEFLEEIFNEERRNHGRLVRPKQIQR